MAAHRPGARPEARALASRLEAPGARTDAVVALVVVAMKDFAGLKAEVAERFGRVHETVDAMQSRMVEMETELTLLHQRNRNLSVLLKRWQAYALDPEHEGDGGAHLLEQTGYLLNNPTASLSQPEGVVD